MGQQEAFRSAMSQINEDVEGKLDRMELQPLKDYFGNFSGWEGCVCVCGSVLFSMCGCKLICVCR